MVQPLNSEALAEACKYILDLDLDTGERLGTKARDWVDDLFSLHRMVDAYQQLYENVAGASAS